MTGKQLHEQKLRSVIDGLDSTLEWEYRYFRNRSAIIPSRKEVIQIIKRFQELMFSDYFSVEGNEGKQRLTLLDEAFIILKRQISAAYAFSSGFCTVNTEDLAHEVLAELPSIKGMLIKDIQALYEGDPAARSAEEVILSYPGFYAISIYRIAHVFYSKGIPYIGRLMTEFAHEKTGIDIHAGATIGEYFFVDHGTGIVIGETTTIGNHVKIYQGVTLGAKSFELDSDGNPVKGIKRHPDIGDNCVIYANATILGGNTRIGNGCIIGANVWITSSVADGEVVYYGKRGEK